MKRNESNINTWSGKMEPEAISYWMQEADKSAALGIGVGIDAKSLYEICDLALRATDPEYVRIPRSLYEAMIEVEAAQEDQP